MRTGKATLLRHDKVLLKNGVVVETKIWKVPLGDKYPDGLKYSLFGVQADGRVLVGYDNHHPKGHGTLAMCKRPMILLILKLCGTTSVASLKSKWEKGCFYEDTKDYDSNKIVG